MNKKKQLREAFRSIVFARDMHRCKMCSAEGRLDAHHIVNRNLMPNGGYVCENGISLCPSCHKKAEAFYSDGIPFPGYSVEELFGAIGSSYELAFKMSEKL